MDERQIPQEGSINRKKSSKKTLKREKLGVKERRKRGKSQVKEK